MVAWKHGVCSEQLECVIGIQLRIVDVWFLVLLHISSNSMAEQISAHVTVCSCKAFGHHDGAVV